VRRFNDSLLRDSVHGIMLFGFRVPNWVRTMATFLVAFGTLMSAFWIIVLNSLDAHPQGLR
jgi:cytochrome d ubiquinol oxidase subunit I